MPGRKSEVAIEFAHQLLEKKLQTHVFYVRGSNSTTFRTSYRAIATELRLPGYDDPKYDPLNSVLNWLSSDSSGPWLLILDNIDDVDFVLRRYEESAVQHEFVVTKYLPQRSGGMILITSRDERAVLELVEKQEHVIKVGCMSVEEALALLANKPGCESEDLELRNRLAAALDYIPLALTQAAAHIHRRRRMTMSRYIDLLQTDSTEAISVLQTEHSDDRRHDVPSSVVRTWAVTFQQIQSQHQAAADLLCRMALFEKSNIPEFLLLLALEEGLHEAIDILVGYTMIEEDAESQSFSMHRLVRLATSTWSRKQAGYGRHVEVAFTMLSESYPTGAYETWATCSTLEPHAVALLQQTQLSDLTALSRALLQHRRCIYNHSLGRFSVAEGLARQASEDRTRLLGPEHPDTLTSMDILASTYWKQGKHQQAEELHMVRLGSHSTRAREPL